jgi:arylsulfatase A-like enzyme
MGAGPELHGYTEWGSKVPELPSRVIGKGGIFPTIFSLIDAQFPEEKKGASYTWGGIKYLFERTMTDLDFNGKTEEKTAEKAIDFILREKPAFTFIHFDEPDHAGHSIGHDTPEYYEQVERIDGMVGKIINRLKESGMMDDTIVIFSSDHGGINKGHGGKTLLEIQIPWIIYGKGVAAKGKLETSIVTYDTAATIAYILGLEQPQSWIGRPVLSAFENSKKNN